MIFQLSDWFPKPMIWAIIVKFDQIRKNWWRISCAEILEVGKNFSAASAVKKMSRFEEVSPEKIKRIAWKFTKVRQVREEKLLNINTQSYCHTQENLCKQLLEMLSMYLELLWNYKKFLPSGKYASERWAANGYICFLDLSNKNN